MCRSTGERGVSSASGKPSDRFEVGLGYDVKLKITRHDGFFSNIIPIGEEQTHARRDFRISNRARAYSDETTTTMIAFLIFNLIYIPIYLVIYLFSN